MRRIFLLLTGLAGSYLITRVALEGLALMDERDTLAKELEETRFVNDAMGRELAEMARELATFKQDLPS